MTFLEWHLILLSLKDANYFRQEVDKIVNVFVMAIFLTRKDKRSIEILKVALKPLKTTERGTTLSIHIFYPRISLCFFQVNIYESEKSSKLSVRNRISKQLVTRQELSLSLSFINTRMANPRKTNYIIFPTDDT